MIWENSSYLWLLLSLPLIYGVYYWYKQRNINDRASYFDERLLNQLLMNQWKFGDKIRLFALLFSALFFILALAGPKIGTEVREVQKRGLNLMVALDLSRSMNSEDINPNRLSKAKFELNRLINRLQGDRVGLIVFTDEAFIQVPLTTDYSAFRMLMDIANTDQMPSNGTNFRSAMQKSIEAFESIDNQNNAANVLLFMADGENHGPSYDSALSRLIDMGVFVLTVGVGTPEGGPIPLYTTGARLTGYVRDTDNNTVISRLGSETMRDIASRGRGEYYEIQSGRDNIEPFFSKLDELERGEYSTQEFADYINRYQILLIIGLFFFMFSLFFPDTKADRDLVSKSFSEAN